MKFVSQLILMLQEGRRSFTLRRELCLLTGLLLFFFNLHLFLRGTLLLVAFGFVAVALARLLAVRLGLTGSRRWLAAGRGGRGLASSTRAPAGVGTV